MKVLQQAWRDPVHPVTGHRLPQDHVEAAQDIPDSLFLILFAPRETPPQVDPAYLVEAQGIALDRSRRLGTRRE